MKTTAADANISLWEEQRKKSLRIRNSRKKLQNKKIE